MKSAKVLAAFCALFLLFTLTTITYATEEKPSAWTMVKEHSSVNFAVKHLMISKVRGTFKDFSATITADKNGKILGLEGIVMTGSVDTGVKMRDDHLRSPDFFDSAKFPEMKAVLKKITWKGNKFTAEGDLTIKGITKTVTASGEFLGMRMVNMGVGDKYYAGFSITGSVNRRDFGLNFAKVINGTAVVDDKVEIYGELEMTMPVVK